jgi:hypothetical protein
MNSYYVTVTGFGHVKSFYVQAESAAEARKKALLSCNISVSWPKKRKQS